MSQSSGSTDLRAVELGEDNKQKIPLKTDDDDAATGEAGKQNQENVLASPPVPLDHYVRRKFFVARPGALDQAVEDLKSQVLVKENAVVQSVWLLTEIDHWNNEKERIVLITDQSLLICKYDFIMLCSLQIQSVPLNYVDRICLGQFTFPPKSLDKREGEGLRIYWDKLREPSFLSRWNPWSVDVPYTTFTEHPMKNCSEKFTTICQLDIFTTQLVQAVQNAHAKNPVPGRANGALVLNQPILIETYTGWMAYIGNRNKLGYSLARGSVGF
ncbi:tumor protein p63-regulated gene 1 protein [Microcaecilia unicolor]|uniref:Tumor protein p63-regulated gene 1 protein n=1 Tax=Microcaecilia unicolor TaxID=1415580 RepID=A0A6P7Z4F6_9AMPH|nr:tumor protein p63-regulated gene 1 protein [Microcaecilia unicolor]